MRGRSPILTLLLAVLLVLCPMGIVLAQDVNVGYLDANLSSAVSNSANVTWYNFSSPYSSISSGPQNPPSILVFCSQSSLNFVVDYRCRDDSSVSGKSQEVKLDVWKWNPNTYSWDWTGSQGKSHGSTGWSKYSMTGTMSQNSWWSSSTNIALFKIQGYAKSGDKTATKTRQAFVARTVTKTGTGYADAPRWMADRYYRSLFYNQIYVNLQQIASDADGSSTTDGLNIVIDYGKAFVQPSAVDFGISTGLDALSIINAAWKTVPATGEILDATGVMSNGLSMVQAAISLLTTGIRDAIASAQRPAMTQQAAAYLTGVQSSLNTLANASRDEAKALEDLVYGTGTVSNWQSKLDTEKAAIDSALSSITSARSSLSTWRSGYTGYSTVPLIGTDTQTNADAVQTNLNQYLTYIEDQLKSDKYILDKAASL